MREIFSKDFIILKKRKLQDSQNTLIDGMVENTNTCIQAFSENYSGFKIY